MRKVFDFLREPAWSMSLLDLFFLTTLALTESTVALLITGFYFLFLSSDPIVTIKRKDKIDRS